MGWIVWRDADALPRDLVFWVDYLGDNMPTFALNFSRPGAQVVAQYYTSCASASTATTRCSPMRETSRRGSSGKIAELGPFELITHGDQLPVFAFKVKDEVDNFTAFDVSASLRERGWQVPAYTFPANRTDLAALRVVVRLGSATTSATCSSATSSGSCRGCRSSRSPFTAPPSRASTTDVCRLFGLTSGPHRVHARFWLLEAPDSIVTQSHRNADGTGLGFYEPDGEPVLDKEPLAAYEDARFARRPATSARGPSSSHVRLGVDGRSARQEHAPVRDGGRMMAHNGASRRLPLLEQELGGYGDWCRARPTPSGCSR